MIPPVVDPSQPASAPPVVPDPLTPDPSIEAPLLSDTELLDLFQRPLYDIHRAWRAPLFRIVRRLSQAILDGTQQAEDKCTLALLLLTGLVAACLDTSGRYLISGIDRATTDEDFGNIPNAVGGGTAHPSLQGPHSILAALSSCGPHHDRIFAAPD